jgi:asparagine synthase (glutamine-hydrolysing)
MFAFVIWDTEKQELFGGRDHFGIKPFYYSEIDGGLIYGSEIKSFLHHPAFNKVLNKRALKPYLTFQYSATDETFFENVYRLPEGHYLLFKDGKLTIEQYWDVTFSEENMTLDQTIDDIEKIVSNSVEAHFEAEVPIGTFLSSGVDSSYVTAVARPEHTYSIGFGSGYNEADAAARLAEKLELNNTSRTISPEEAFEKFPLIQYHLDEPDSNPSCVPLYFLTELASRDVTVALSGEGADELFAGYTEYGLKTNSKAIFAISEQMRRMPKGMRRLAYSMLKNAHFPGRDQLFTAVAPAEKSFLGQAFVFSEDEASNLLTAAYQDAPSVQEIVDEQYKKVAALPELKKKQYLDLHQWMPKDILLKADKLAMAHSLEVRTPLLDKEVMNVAKRIPSKYLITAENTKYAFRKAANRHLPDEWADRTKLGFPVPIKDWLKEEKYYKEVRHLFEAEFVTEFFDQDSILNLLDDYYAGHSENQRKIWTIFTFLTWYKVYFVNEELPTVEVRSNFPLDM